MLANANSVADGSTFGMCTSGDILHVHVLRFT